jgi:hypothetical protein
MFAEEEGVTMKHIKKIAPKKVEKKKRSNAIPTCPVLLSPSELGK